ncbi:hypothetical protein [Francisella sp. 19X1-34]|uniref:FTN_0109 family protein n=1 Tax=Francisella sp. 19X1-34 TaxID=3087177 RepID=UPI002E320759|nr:hypothetical protein [Francisella sp. 19X1-34]MED7789546.1 hypothetical protein [Francisella sp. 19X1-34]
MSRFIKFFFLIVLTIVLSNCAIITDHNFVYLGHPIKLSEYQLYYDKTQNLYLFIDKYSCFDKSVEGAGTCMALNQQEADNFIKQILPKLSETEDRLEEDHKEKVVAGLKKYNKKVVKRPVKLELKLRPVKQINAYGKKEYHLVPRKYNVKVNLILMLDESNKQDSEVRVLYSLRMPGVIRNQKTSTKPFLIDPEYLEKVMNEKAVKNYEDLYNNYVKKTKKNRSEFEHFLNDELHI